MAFRTSVSLTGNLQLNLLVNKMLVKSVNQSSETEHTKFWYRADDQIYTLFNTENFFASIRS